MAGIDCSIHYTTLKQIGYDESNVAVSFYHDRTHFEPSQRNFYAEFTEEFYLQQGRHFVLHNRYATTPYKMTKLKDKVKEFDALISQTITHSRDLERDENQMNEILSNRFFSSFGSNLTKILWLGENRLVLIFQDATLCWVVIDPLSGDILKMLIDKSLSTLSSSNENNLKLSGNHVCDFVVVLRDSFITPIIAIAYFDKSKLDLVTFGKGHSFYDFVMNNQKNTSNLEKLSHYEPSTTSFEFSCPSYYMIEKRLITIKDEKCHPTFCLWWSNDTSNVLKLQNTQTNSVSLLEKDDLRSNILLLSSNLSDTNLIENIFKSEGHLVSLFYSNKSNLIAIEQTEINTHKNTFTIHIYKYELSCNCDDQDPKPKSPKIKLNSFNLNSRIQSINQIKHSRNFLAILSTDQTLVVYDLNRNLVFKTLVKSSDLIFNGIEWALEDLLIFIYDLNGEVKLYDIACNQINLNYMTRFKSKLKSLNEHLNPSVFTKIENLKSNLLHVNRFVRISSCEKLFANSLWTCFHFTKGPFGLLRLGLPDDFNSSSLITHYLKSDQVDESVKLLKMLNWNENAQLCLTNLYKILNFVLSNKITFNLKTETLIEEALSTFYQPKRPLNEKVIFEYRHQVSRYARKYFYALLKSSNLNKAYLLAVDISSKDLFNDLYYVALSNNEKRLGEMCRKKYYELAKEEISVKKRAEMNRSIDDNIKGAFMDYDRLSISSGEGNETENSGDDDNDSNLSDSNDDSDYLHELGLKFSTNKLTNKNYEKANTSSSSTICYNERIFGEEELENFSKKLAIENTFVNNYFFEKL
jgi:hypothetical protein